VPGGAVSEKCMCCILEFSDLVPYAFEMRALFSGAVCCLFVELNW
jgi:hypothetical protein